MNNQNPPGEEQITPQTAQQVAPDIVSDQGQQQLLAKTIAAHRIKNMLDTAFDLAAKHIPGATFNSRIKNMDVAQKKIVQKRMQGRDYDIDSLNDIYGGRFTVEHESDFKKVKKELSDMENIGLFKIGKQETVKTGNYEAFHTDIIAPDGTRGEIQIHLPQSEASSVATHDLRALYGEKPPPLIKKLVDTQANITENLPSNKARAVTQALQSLHKQNNDKPLPLPLTASIVNQASQ